MDTAKAMSADNGHVFPSLATGFIPSVVASVSIEGCDTDISIMEFTDKLFIVISQYKKLGTLVLVTKDAANCDDPKTLVYTTKGAVRKGRGGGRSGCQEHSQDNRDLKDYSFKSGIEKVLAHHCTKHRISCGHSPGHLKFYSVPKFMYFVIVANRCL
ncbi:hypothetical protein MRX96_039786 [Rhipicephalus microplus]